MDLRTPIRSPLSAPFLIGSLLLILPLNAMSDDKDIEVRVDRRVEAFAIVQYLADRLDAFPSPYQRAVEEHFRPYEDHPAVDLVRKMMNIDTLPKGVHSESCMLAMYLQKDLEGIHPLNEQDSSVYSSYYGHERIVDLLRLLPDFMNTTAFASFRRKMKPYYERWEREMESFLEGKERIGPFDDLYEVQSNWLIILNPLKKIQSAHATRTIPSFNKDTNCFSYSYREEGVKDSVAFLKSDRKMRDLFWHEGTHLVLGEGTFVRYKDELGRFSQQFDSCRTRIGQTFGYEKWLRYMDECIAYGASLYLLKKEKPEQFPYQRLLMKYNGFAHTEQVLNSFARYDSLGTKSKDVAADLYPLLIDELEKVEEGKSGLATDYEALKKKGMKMEQERKKEKK